MASLFPQMEPDESPTSSPSATSPPDDLLERARQTAMQEMESMRNPGRQPQQQSKSTLLTGHRRFE